MQAISEEQASSGADETAFERSQEKDPCLPPALSLVNPTRYGSTKKTENRDLGTGNTSSSGYSSQCPLGSETERGYTWPMQ